MISRQHLSLPLTDGDHCSKIPEKTLPSQQVWVTLWILTADSNMSLWLGDFLLCLHAVRLCPQARCETILYAKSNTFLSAVSTVSTFVRQCPHLSTRGSICSRYDVQNQMHFCPICPIFPIMSHVLRVHPFTSTLTFGGRFDILSRRLPTSVGGVCGV